jgi:hypothetical protein
MVMKTEIASVVSLKLLYNDNKGCHSRETCPRPDRGTGIQLKRLDSPLSSTGQA